MFNYQDAIYYMGNEEKLSWNDCDYLALAKSILQLDASEIQEGDLTKEADMEAVAKEFAIKFYRKDGGYISQIRRHLNVDLELFDKNNLVYQSEKFKILYMFYVLKKKYPKIKVIEMLGKPSMENIDNFLFGWKTYNGDIIHFVKDMLERELSREFINNVYGAMEQITPAWDIFYKKFSYQVDLYASMGEIYDFEAIISSLKEEPDALYGADELIFDDLSPIPLLYLRIVQNEQLGQIKDILVINNIQIESNYNVPLKIVEEMKALDKRMVEVSSIEKYIDTDIDKIAGYVYLKKDISKAERRRILYNKKKVLRVFEFCIRAKQQIPIQMVSTELFIISCLQAILLDDQQETFDYVFPGYQQHMKHKPHVQGALKRDGEPIDALKFYWVRKVMDHWYANIGRYDIRCKEREVENLCDNILVKILSCHSIPEMLRLHYSYYNKIMQ